MAESMTNKAIRRISEADIRKMVTGSVLRVLEMDNNTTTSKSSDNVFNLDEIPTDVLDNGWTRYRPFLYNINHRNPLAVGALTEGADYKAQIEEVRNAIVSTFPINKLQFKIVEGCHGLYAAILSANVDDNISVIEDMMKKKGFFRSQPTNDNVLLDYKNREWVDMRFELQEPDDVTDELHEKYSTMCHLAPKIFSDSILTNGIKVSNNNPVYKYSENRAYFMEGKISDEYINTEVQALANALYAQAKLKDKDLQPNYTLFVFDLSKLDESFRFFYDVNEPKGIYTKTNVPSSIIIGTYDVTAKAPQKKLL